MAISIRFGVTHIEDGEPAPWVGQQMTLDEFLALPEVKPYLEYQDGIVRQKMWPTFVHIEVQRIMANAINRVSGPGRLGSAYIELRIVTPGWSPTPDVSYYRRGRIKRREVLANEAIRIAPDISIEVVSPSQSVTELIAKSKRYLALGTTISLIIDPGQVTVLVLRPDQTIDVLGGEDRISLDDVLPGFDLTVQEVFDAVAADLDDDDEPLEPAEIDAQDQTSSSY